MNNCIKNSYDYDLIKKCSQCGKVSLKSNFHERSKSSDGLDPRCIPCLEKYYSDNRDRAKQYYLDH